VEWAMGYMDPQNHIGVPRSWHGGRLLGVGTMGTRSVTPDADAFEKAHFTVIQQLHLITPFANEHKRQLREDNPNRGRSWLAKMHMQGFSRWLQNYVETCSNNAVITDEIKNLAAGPLFTVTRYEGMDINGYTLYTMTRDKKSVYQNSGVRVWAVVDDNHDDDDYTEIDTYYGQIEEIWELDYVGLKVALFRCRWVTNEKRAVSKDKYVYVSVDLRVFGYKNELFIFANSVEHVFYVPDLAKKNWSVVMPEKNGLWGLKMLLRRRNTTSLTKFHPLTLHTSPNSSELTKHHTCEATTVKQSIYRNQGRKSKPDFC
jgi:hypothetical protein